MVDKSILTILAGFSSLTGEANNVVSSKAAKPAPNSKLNGMFLEKTALNGLNEIFHSLIPLGPPNHNLFLVWAMSVVKLPILGTVSCVLVFVLIWY